MAKKDEATKDEAPNKEVATKKDSSTQENQNGFSAVEFIKGTKEELDKVVWPSRQQLISESLAVILMVSLSASIIYLVDKLFSWASQQIF